jgi:hypothetical protein
MTKMMTIPIMAIIIIVIRVVRDIEIVTKSLRIKLEAIPGK